MNYARHPVENQELMAYLDGELAVERAADVAGHLNQCAECQGVADDFRVLSQQMLAWRLDPPSERLTEGVMAATENHAQEMAQPIRSGALRTEARKRHSFVGRWFWGLAGASLVLLLLVLGYPYKQGRLPSTLRPRMVSNVETGAYKPDPRDTRDLAGYDQLAKRKDALLLNDKEGVVGGTLKNEFAEVGKLDESGPPPATGPMIVRTAYLALVTKEFEKARTALEQILRQRRGYLAELAVTGQPGAGHVLNATLRLPADQLDAVLTEIKKLGRVTQESQGGQEVTQRYVDMSARLSNARTTEQRLIDVLQQRTGRVKDILAVEQEIARVRGEIEEMEAEKKSLEKQVSFATLRLQVSEEYKAQLDVAPPSTGTLLHNTLVGGVRRAVDGVLDLVLILFGYGPILLFWSLLLLWPARLIWRRLQFRWGSVGRRVDGEPGATA
jgi:hypothetical protein